MGEDVMYLALPSVLGVGALGAVLGTVVLIRLRLRLAADCYALGFLLANLLLLAAGGLMRIGMLVCSRAVTRVSKIIRAINLFAIYCASRESKLKNTLKNDGHY